MKARRVATLLNMDVVYVADGINYHKIRKLIGPSLAMRYDCYIVRSYPDGEPKNVWGGNHKDNHCGIDLNDFVVPVMKNGVVVR